MSDDGLFEIHLKRAYFEGAIAAAFHMFDRKEKTARQALEMIRAEQKKLHKAIRDARFQGNAGEGAQVGRPQRQAGRMNWLALLALSCCVGFWGAVGMAVYRGMQAGGAL